MHRSGTFALAAAIVLAWFLIAGTRSTVTIAELAGRGGATALDWTLLTAQFVHVRRPHMFLNVVHLLLLGWWMEPRLRTPPFLLLYLLGGGLGELAVVVAGQVATGASQSTAALAGAAVLLARTRGEVAATAIVIAMIAGLDLYFAHTLKIGHIAGFVAGAALSVLLRSRAAR